jgi:hypothetical protein
MGLLRLRIYPEKFSRWHVIATLCLSITANAQRSDIIRSDHVIGIQFGVNQIKEENLHSKVNRGTSTELFYAFEKRRQVWNQFQFTIGYSRLKTGLEDLSKTINLKLDFDYSLNFSVAGKRNMKYYVGPAARVMYNVSFYPNWDDSHLYWADYYALGVNNILFVQLENENQWVTSLSFPLFSIFSRPDLYREYKIDDTDFAGIVRNLNSDLAPAVVTNLFYVRFRTEYRVPIFNDKQQGFTFSTDYSVVRKDGGNAFSQLCYQVGINIRL